MMVESINAWRYSTDRALASPASPPHPAAPRSDAWAPLTDLAQIVGTDDARKIYDKVALLRAAPPPASPRFAPYHAGSDATDEPYERRSGEAYAERPVKREEDEGGVEADAEAEANEVYILALATALQRAPDAEPCRVEVRVRQALKQLGMCLETCRAYFLLSQRGKDSGRLD